MLSWGGPLGRAQSAGCFNGTQYASDQDLGCVGLLQSQHCEKGLTGLTQDCTPHTKDEGGDLDGVNGVKGKKSNQSQV